MSNIQVEPITLRQHLLHPFSFKVHGAKNYTAMIPPRQRIAALVAAVATAIFGIPFAVVGGPLIFYVFTRVFKAKRIQQIKQSNVPIPPGPNPIPNPVPNPPVGRINPVVPNNNRLGGSALHDACARGQLNQVRALIDRGESLNSTDREGNYPIHVAAMNGHPEIVQLLLERRGELGNQLPQRNNWNGRSPLSLALERVIPSIGTQRYADARAILNMVCSSPLARGNLDRLVEALKPFARYDVVRELTQFQHNSVASTLLDRLMLAVLREQNFTDAGNPVAFDRKLREQPFIFSVENDEVLVHILERNDPVTIPLTKQQFYHVWSQADGNLNQIRTRVLEARERPIQIPAPQPAAVVEPMINMGNFGALGGGLGAAGLGGESYYIRVLNRGDFKANPDAILNQLCKQFDRAKCHRLRVTYEGERGTDAGGLRRQFVTDLFSNISNKLQFQRFDNGLFRPQARPGTEFPAMTANDKKICQDLGKMIMFCLNTAEEYPTGLIFDPGTFVALVKMDPKFLNQKFEDIKFTDPAIYASMYAVYKAMNQSNEDESKAITRTEGFLALTAASPDQALKDAYGSVMAEDDIEKLNIDINNVPQIKQHLDAIKAAVKTSIIDKMKATFGPIHAIATGMKDAGFENKVRFSNLRHMRPADLSKQLQGAASKQDVIDRVTCHGSGTTTTPVHIKAWFTNWVNKADDKKLELFLYAATGASALGSNSRINFIHSNGFAFHTCSGQIDLNFNVVSNENDLAALLEAHLDLIKNSPDFNMS